MLSDARVQSAREILAEVMAVAADRNFRFDGDELIRALMMVAAAHIELWDGDAEAAWKEAERADGHAE